VGYAQSHSFDLLASSPGISSATGEQQVSGCQLCINMSQV